MCHYYPSIALNENRIEGWERVGAWVCGCVGVFLEMSLLCAQKCELFHSPL